MLSYNSDNHMFSKYICIFRSRW